MNFYISGTGSALPEKIVSNDDLSLIMDTSDEWISKRTGIRSRHIITTETLGELSVEAGAKAIADAGLCAEQIDMVICATLRGDYYTPSQACVIAAGLNISAPAFDINAACTGSIYALFMAEAFFKTGKAKNILVVACEAMSKIMDWADRSTAVLFGDGAAAMVLSEGNSLKSCHIACVPNIKLITAPVNTDSIPITDALGREIPPAEKQTLKMDGPEVYKFAVKTMISEMEQALSLANLTIDDINYVLPHQANLRIIDAAKKRFNIPDGKVLMNIAECGNVSATSVMLLLDGFARSGTFKKGDKLLLVAFGAGMTAGAAIIEWAK